MKGKRKEGTTPLGMGIGSSRGAVEHHGIDVEPGSRVIRLPMVVVHRVLAGVIVDIRTSRPDLGGTLGNRQSTLRRLINSSNCQRPSTRRAIASRTSSGAPGPPLR